MYTRLKTLILIYKQNMFANKKNSKDLKQWLKRHDAKAQKAKDVQKANSKGEHQKQTAKAIT